MNYFLTYKPEGATPLETLESLRHEKEIGVDVPMTYAGRLDPMAEGLLLILVGDECKKKDEYLGLDKEYEVEILLGIGSDTGDILGLIKGKESLDFSKKLITEDIIKEKSKLLIGRRSEKYPAYSSKTVNGKPLFAYTKEGSIDEIEIPEKEIEIYSVDFINTETIAVDELVDTAIRRIEKVNGDFRQSEVADLWRNLLNSNKDDSESGGIGPKFLIAKLKIKSSSGAYMRNLAEKFGESLGVKALAWKIKRTKIGDFTL